jgi:outer membrane receptor protein involved in Fe transport
MIMHHATKLSFTAALLAATCLTGTTSYGQAGPAPKAAPAGETLETVVVTATKRAKSIEDIPATISAITGAELERRATQSLSDIVALVPGVNLTAPAGNAARITIRGIGGEANTNPTAGVLFGDVSFNDSYVPHNTLDPNPFDMANVEVLKGPQGTLFGASALNGAVRYVPAEPELGQFGAKYYVQGAALTDGNTPWSIGGMVNVPVLDDSLAVRVVMTDANTPGWIDNTLHHDPDSNRGHQYGGRALVTWLPIDKLKIDLTYAMQWTRTNDSAAADNANGNLVATNRLRASPNKSHYDLVSLRADYDFDVFTLTSESAYVRKYNWGWGEGSQTIIPGGTIPISDNYGTNQSKSISQEIRLVSNDTPESRWSWVAGLFASRQDIVQTGTYEFGDPSVNPLVTAAALNNIISGIGTAWYYLGEPHYNDSKANVAVTELAGFFDVTRKLGDSFEVSFGGRLYQTTSGGIVVNKGLLMMLTGFPVGQTIDDKIKESGFNPKFSLTWHVTDSALLYTTVSKGYRVGGVQWGTTGIGATAPAPSLFKTDTIWNYEVGLRSRWLDDTLQLDVTGFYENWKNPQVLMFDTVTNGTFIDNVGNVVSQGVEASAEYMVPWVKGLRARGSISYTNAATTTPFLSRTGSQTIAAGTPWPLSPKWQTATTLDYQHGFDGWTLGGSVSDNFISHSRYGIDQTDKIFGYNNVDAQIRVGLLNLPTQPEIALIVNNVFDIRGINTAYSGSFWHQVYYNQPRTVMMRISGAF